MTEKIKFIARDEYGWTVAPKPYPAIQGIPKWWRDMTPYIKDARNPEGKKFILENSLANTSAKKCIPMLDSLGSGYIIPLWSDIQIRTVNDEPRITWRVSEDVFQMHGRQSSEIETPFEYHPQPFKFMNKWTIQTPKGYSILVVQPFGYRQTGLQAIPAVIDTDKSTLEVLPPLWIKKDFEGIIEKGTPIVQIIPFKRSDWKAEYSFLKDNEYKRIEDKGFGSTLINHYAKFSWQKKNYS